MPNTRKPYPPEFREQLVALVRTGRTPDDLAREFEPTAQSIANWVAQADRDAGRRTDGLSDAYDNAMAESFFATLEREVLNRRRFRSQAEARMAIFQWLEGWYNPHRRHSALGYCSPINYERRQLRATA